MIKLFFPLLFVILYNDTFCQFDLLKNDSKILTSTSRLGINGEIARLKINPLNKDFISFESYEKGEKIKLWFLNLNENIPNEIKLNKRYANPNNFEWYPQKVENKFWFFFQAKIDNNIDIFLGNTKDNYYARLTNNTGDNKNPIISPDGKNLVYSSSQTGQGDLYLIQNIPDIIKLFNRWISSINSEEYEDQIYSEFSKRKHKQLTFNQRPDFNPFWASNSKDIVYQSFVNKENNELTNIFSLDISKITVGKTPESIFSSDLPGVLPGYSPDCNKVAIFIPSLDTILKKQNIYNLGVITNKKSTTEVDLLKSCGDILINENINPIPPLWFNNSSGLFYIKKQGHYTSVCYVDYQFWKSSDGMNGIQTLLPPSDSVTYMEISGKYFENNRFELFYITFENQDYYIKSLLVQGPNETIPQEKKNNLSVYIDFMPVIYSSQISKVRFIDTEFGSFFGVEYIPTRESSSSFEKGFYFSIGRGYLSTANVTRKMFLITEFGGELLYNLPDTYIESIKFLLSVNVIDISRYKTLITPAFGLGMNLNLEKNINLFAAVKYNPLFSNIDKTRTNKSDLLLNFQLGLHYYFTSIDLGI